MGFSAGPNYQLKAADLVGGDGLFANTIDLVPGTSLDFNHSLDPNTGLPVSNLNAVSIDTASAQLNSGLVQTINANGDLSSNPATNTNLQTMFQALWNYQEQYGEAKVGFTLDPIATPKPDVGFEQYSGFELGFSVAPGPAISVNKQGQLVFDLADEISITSSGTDPSNSREIPLPSDLRDGVWHYVVASYLPDFRQNSINGVESQVPVNRGTATLYVDNQLVASRNDVTDAYIASNINDNALLLANNASGSIDQFALYNKVLLPESQLVAKPDGNWPVASQQNALAILKQLGYPATAETPNPGAIESALTEHWRSRTVNPNNALLATFSSVLDPTTNSWSQAAPLNPIAQLEPTTPSATAPSLQQDLVIAIAPGDWSQNLWTTQGSTAMAFNPGGDQLRSISVTLTPDQGGAVVTRQLSPQQVLIGANTTLASLQPQATNRDTDASNTFALSLDGVNDVVIIPDNSSLDLSNQFTLEALIYPTSNNSGIIFNKENSYEIARFPDGTIQFALASTGTGDWDWINSGLVAPINSWSHVAMTKNGSSVTVYLNGGTAAGGSQFTYASAPATMAGNAESLRIGGRAIFPQYFGGRIDEARVWNRALSQVEVDSQRSQQISGTSSGLVGYYRLNEGTGTTAVNLATATGSALNGRLTDGPVWSNAVQPLTSSDPNSSLDYTFVSNQPAVNLLISRQARNAGDDNNLDLTKSYTATISISVVSDPSQTTPLDVVTRTIPGFNTAGGQVFSAIDGNAADAKALKTQFSARSKTLATAAVIEAAPLQLKYIDSGVVLNSASSVAAANSPAVTSPATSFGQSQAYGWFKSSTDNTYSGWLAIAQTNSANAISNPAGRVWIQYTGDFTSSNAQTSTHTAVTDPNTAPNTWLNALANSNFSPETANRPLLNDYLHPAAYGGLLIQADPTAGWGQNFGQTMLVMDVNGDGTDDLVLSTPSANGGGKVVIIDGAWIQANLTSPTGNTILNLANPDNAGPSVTVLSPGKAIDPLYASDDASQAGFGWALAFDKTSKTLYIGAPNYSRTVGPEDESVPIGAIYRYQNSLSGTTFNSGLVMLAGNYAVGIAGSTSTNDVSGPFTSYWGAQLGASLAVSAEGALAAGAPGVQASLLYSGTDAVEQVAAGKKNPSAKYGQGALIKIMLPTALAERSTGLDVMVSSSNGTSNPNLVDVITNNTTNKKSALAQEENTYMQALKELQTKPIAKANLVNNPAIQTAAVGSLYLFSTASKLLPGTLNPANASATFYGPNPWNTQGATDFGASLSFGDLSNTNSQSILSIGAPQSGGPGAVYLVDSSKPFDNPSSTAPNWIQETNLGSSTLGYQYLAHLTSALTLYGAEDFDSCTHSGVGTALSEHRYG